MKKLILILFVLILILNTIAFASKNSTLRIIGAKILSMGTVGMTIYDAGAIGPVPSEGFLLLETTGDKLLLETGVTDALLLEG